MRIHGLMARIRDVTERWSGTLSVAGIAALCELGARIGLPGVDVKVVEHFIKAGHGGLIALYNLLAGGGLSRAAVLAVGIVPYLTARIWLWIGRSLSADIRRATADQRTKTAVIRGMTTALAAVQSLGYVKFLMSIPNAVAEPGPLFVIRSVLLLTGSAVVVGLLAEQLISRPTTPQSESAGEPETFASLGDPVV